MAATIIYWGMTFALIGWGVWNLIFSIIYLKNKENSNLWFFAILNTLTVLCGLLFWWVFNNHGWQEYWLVKATTTNSLLGGVLIAYVVLIVAQVILGREPKVKTAQ
ncbi:hypothetical protein [Latilactobacillus graminis]|uniref:Membrane protein n=2 Tax=Latilactobacillus graminis TaxID=60519 RepID=A0AA89I6C3_9LACO|nr:hypothetical protein [Latilactobacillus graminis]KRM24004.1 membrane protein [Latilactobacillus graminis DSM 20719]